jgi:type IV secretion system protein VirB2
MHSIAKSQSTQAMWLRAILLTLLLFVPGLVLATTTGGGLPYEADLEKARNSFSGPVAMTFAIGGIVGAGATLIWGSEMNGFLRTVIYLLCVLSFVLGVSSWISGRGAEIAAIDQYMRHALAAIQARLA